MVQLYTVERYAADARAQQLTDAHTARLLRQAHVPRSPIARLQVWWKQVAAITHRRSATQPVSRYTHS